MRNPWAAVTHVFLNRQLGLAEIVQEAGGSPVGFSTEFTGECFSF